MEKFIILADVACDISEEIREFAGVTDYLQGHINFSDGRDFRTTLDWSNIGREEFYKTLSSNKVKITTAPASPEEYYLKFKDYVLGGYKILSISISSKISSTFNVAEGAAKRVMEEVEGSTIYCVDSNRMSGAFGLLVMYAHLLQKEGKTFDEIKDWLEQNKNRVHQMGPIDDLIFVAKRGRITMGKAIMGNFAGVKPMGDCNRDGYVTVLTKVKGIGKALDLTASYFGKTAADIENSYVIISHSNREQYANKLCELIKEKYNPKKIFISDVFCGSGTNVGPGMVGVYYLGEEVSEDLSCEKEILLELAGK